MRILIYRPDKKEPKLDKECLYNSNGSQYKEPEEKPRPHPLDKIYKYPVKSSFIEVER